MFHPPLLASNWFLFCLCLNRDIYSTCCYCDILLRYAKHFCFKSVLCSSTWMPHRWLCLILVELHKRRSRFVSIVPVELFQILVSTTWYLFNLLLLRHFASLRETLCLISVQLRKMRSDFLFVLADSYFILVFSWKVNSPSSTWLCSVLWDVVLLVLVLF